MLEINDIRPLRDDELAEWDKLVADSPEGIVYHSSIWLKAISKAVQQKVLIYGFFSNKLLLGGMPLVIRKKGPISIAQRAFATPYSWIVLKDAKELGVSLDLSNVYRFVSKNFSQAILTSSPYQSSPNFLSDWDMRGRATFVLNIEDKNTVWKSFVPELRNQIRKAEGAGVTIHKLKEIQYFHQLYEGTFERQGKTTPFTENRFVNFINTIHEEGIGTYYLATLEDGRPCAAALMICDEKRVYYSLAASDSELRKTGAAPLLIWKAVQDYSFTHSEMDLGGANIPSITQFKKQFRGELRHYQEAQSFRSTAEQAILSFYQKVRGE